ncbi:MAG: putative toxin-antitoxin system toxin component, PIN family [Candidatus Wallbacteria bacterium]|nr:putative toxin-antitoxin system toxin component, PIN family [Candidatus Wallbacteria bacterium]
MRCAGRGKRKPLKVVIDTNALISALLFGGKPGELISLWKTGEIIPFFSPDTFAEFTAVLSYPKFKLTKDETRLIIEEETLPYFEVLEPPNSRLNLCRDPDDDKFLALAVSAEADFIITGDDDLRSIGKHGKIKILTVAEFLGL